MTRFRFERHVLLLALGAAAIPTVVALLLLWSGDYQGKTRWTLTLIMVVGVLVVALRLHERVVRVLQTLSNLLVALREGDYSVRARHARADDVLGATLAEVNALADFLRTRRLDEVEASALLQKVISEIDVAVMAFDRAGALRLVNRAGAELLGAAPAAVIGRTAGELRVEKLLSGPAPRTVSLPLPGGEGPWEIGRSSFRLEGQPHVVLVMADVKRALRDEERQAWQRLVRVLGHEINNSLTPIRSIATMLREQMGRSERAGDWEENVARGLAVIERRSEALGRFMTSYARVARLPPPRFAPVDVGSWVRRVVDLEKRVPVDVQPGPASVIQGDGDQLEQMLINILANAAEAAGETGGGVRVGWSRSGGQLEVTVEDEGPGIAEGTNLFVPFFTTKPGGSGIGLVLSRQIAEAHGGTLALAARPGGERGAVARIRLPARTAA